MTTYYDAGDSISGAKILYNFQYAPRPSAAPHGRCAGTLTGKGKAAVIEPLRVMPIGSPSNEADEIICTSATYESDSLSRPKKVSAKNHREWQGYLRGNALATIRVPIRSRAG